ncbi:MAG: hypothetical protein BroJett040_03480 [Oligoflexia bacterium]|nr:MAG: hypothetical protein BroJett040_03480 [Oligoflexia bacterium]
MWKRLTTFDRALFLFAVLACGIFSYLLYDDSILSGFFQQKGGTPIGQLTEISQDVRQKYNHDFAWNKVRKIQKVHLGDSIFTGPDSSVTVITPDGSSLDIKENSLVVFNKTDNQLSLGLKFGSLTGKLNGEIHIDGIESKLSGKNAAFEMSTGSSGKVKITPKSGDLFSVTKSGATKVSTSVVATKAGIKKYTDIKDIPLALARPLKGATVKIKTNEDNFPIEGSNVDFIWKSKSGKDSEYYVIVSTDKELSQIAYQTKTKEKQISTSDLKPGSYYAAIREVFDGKTISQSDIVHFNVEYQSTVQFADIPAPILSTEVLNLQTDGSSPSVISWTPSNGAKEYLIEYSTDPSFKKKKSYKSQTSSIALTGLEEGTYYYRVIPLTESGQRGHASQAQQFQVTHVAELQAPELSTEVVEFKTSNNKPFSLSWKPQDNVDQYQVEISPSKDMNNPQIFQTKTNKYTLQKQAPGLYYYKVKALGVNGKPGPESSLAKFSIVDDKRTREIASTTAPHIDSAQLTYIIGSQKYPKANWKPISGVNQYIVEVSSDPQFTSKKSYNTKEATYTFKEEVPGTYYFRISNFVDKNKAGPHGQVGRLMVATEKPVLTPVEPKQYLPKDVSDKGPPENFIVKWSSITQANSYMIQLSTDSNFTSVKKYQSTTPTATLTLPETGEYFWRVQALGENNKPISDFSDIGSIQYGKKDPLYPPVLIEPMDNMTLFFQKSKQTTFWIEWDETKDAKNYRIELAADRDFKKIIFAKDMTDFRVLVNETLPLGEVFWRVRAENGDKKSAWSPSRKVTILGGKQAQGK